MGKMILSPEQQSILDGARGETIAKVMKTLVMYGETFGAEKMVPVTSEYGHLVTSFGLGVMKPVYALMDQLSPLDYNGGLWNFYEFGGKPLYLAPTTKPRFRISRKNSAK